MKRTRKEMLALTENTQVLSNNWTYQDYRTLDYIEHANIITGWLLTQRNDKQLKELFGRCSFATNNWVDYTRCWVRDFEGETFLIYSSERGTSYEVVGTPSYEEFSQNKELGEICISFIKELTTQLKSLGMNQKDIAEWNTFEQEKKCK